MSAKIPRLGDRERQSNLVRSWGHTSVHWLQRAAEHDRLALVEGEGGMAREREAGRWSHPPWNLSSISPIGLETLGRQKFCLSCSLLYT